MYLIPAIVLLLGTVTAHPSGGLAGRDAPGNINNLPSQNQVCADGTYNQDAIRAAISFAHEAWRSGTKYNPPKSTTVYPHTNTPRGALTRSNFALPGCAQDDSDDGTKRNFIEYPITSAGIWQGQSKPGNDRVLLQYVDHGTANFCGVMKHVSGDGPFQLCVGESEGGGSPPPPPPPPPRTCEPDPECTDGPHPKCVVRDCTCSDGATVPYVAGRCQS